MLLLVRGLGSRVTRDLDRSPMGQDLITRKRNDSFLRNGVKTLSLIFGFGIGSFKCYLLPGTCDPVPAAWYLVPGACYLLPATCYLAVASNLITEGC